MNDVIEEKLDLERLASRVRSVTVTASAPVNAWAIRNWCHVMGINNPLYAKPAKELGVQVAPPAMLQLWTVLELQHHEHGVNRTLRQAFTEAGYTAIVATNYDLQSFKLACVGDLITTKVSLDSISPHKVTPLGEGCFATEYHEWFNQDGDKLGDLKIRCFYFRPQARSGNATAKSAGITPDTAQPGNGLAIHVDSTLVIAGAIVGNDYELVHHDRDLARAQGLPDIIMNIATSAAMAFRFASQCEPTGVLSALSMRLGVPCCPGDVLHISGECSAEVGAERTYTIVGRNQLGDHLKGSLVIQAAH